MMTGKAQQPRRPLRDGMNASSGLERRSLKQNSGLPSSVITPLLRCLFIGIVAYSGCSAAFSSEALDSTPSRRSASQAKWCEAVITPIRNMLSWRRIFKRWTEDRQLVDADFRVIRFSCYFPTKPQSGWRHLRQCKERALQICYNVPLLRMVFEVAETDRHWMAQMVKKASTRSCDVQETPVYLFLRCQLTRSLDDEGSRCQSGKKMRYYNALFDSYQHAQLRARVVGTADSLHDDIAAAAQPPATDEASTIAEAPVTNEVAATAEIPATNEIAAAENALAGRVFIEWGDDVVVRENGRNQPWISLRSRNSLPPAFRRLDNIHEFVDELFQGTCTLETRNSGDSFVYKYESFDDYREKKSSDGIEIAPVTGKLLLERICVPEIFPFLLPDLGEGASVEIVHIKLLGFSRLPNIRTPRKPFKDRASKITTITCRSGDREKSLEKCLGKVGDDIAKANVIFVSTKKYRFLSRFLNILVPGLRGDSQRKELDNYRFVIEGRAAFLKGVTPPFPLPEKEPKPIDPKFLPLITAPAKPVLWQSFSPVDWTVREIEAGHFKSICIGKLSLSFHSSQWHVDLPLYRARFNVEELVIAFHPTRPTFANSLELAEKNQPIYLTRRRNQDEKMKAIIVSCACPFGGPVFQQEELGEFEGSHIAIVEHTKLPLRSTVMFHV